MGSQSTLAGLSSTFRTGSGHLEKGAIIQDVTALHVKIGRPKPSEGIAGPSLSTQIAGLRRLLSGWESKETETGYWFNKAAVVGFLEFTKDRAITDM
jgi:hypothetical protein